MKTKFRNSLILTVILLASFIMLSACNRPDNGNDVNDVPAKRGDFYTLQDAYDNGFITLEDLKNIAYYQNTLYDPNGGIEDESFVPSPKNPEQLSAETELAIRETYAYDLRNNETSPRKDAKTSEQRITGYYGIYNGYVAVRVNVGWFFANVDDEIAGVVFHYSDSKKITVWMSNELEQ